MRTNPVGMSLILLTFFALITFHPVGGWSDDASDVFQPQQDDLPVAPPRDAHILFDGDESVRFVSKAGKKIDWVIKDGTLVSSPGETRSNHIVSTVHFRDADIHVEFMLPEKGVGNSGIYIHGNYELQIINSFGQEKPTQNDMGALYGFAPPLVNAARKPGEWQVYDIRYRAPRRNDKGEITEDGSISAWLNGQKVQDHVRFGEPRSTFHPYRYHSTDYLQRIGQRQKETMIGPVFLQDHDAPVRFRNVWLRPLDDQAQLYEEKAAAD
jgi:hypothetical protein